LASRPPFERLIELVDLIDWQRRALFDWKVGGVT